MASKNRLLESLETNVLSLYPEPNKPKRRVEQERVLSHTDPIADGSVDTVTREEFGFNGHRQVMDLPLGAFDSGTTDYRRKVFIYRSVARSMEVSRAIENIVNEAIVMDDPIRPPVELNLDDVDAPDSLKKKLIESFDHVLKVLKFNKQGQKLFLDWYVDGRITFEKIIDKKRPRDGLKKVKQLLPENIVPIRKIIKAKDPENPQIEVIKRIEKYFIYTPGQKEGYYRQLGNASALSTVRIVFRKNAICDVNSDLYDSDQMIISYLDKAIRPYNQLRAMEDSLVIYRIARAPERRIFYIDTGNLPRQKAEQYIKEIMASYKNKIVYDANRGTIQDSKNIMTIQDDFWLPRAEGKGTQVDTLAGGQNLGQMDDVVYFKENLYTALNVPLTRLQSDTGFQLGRATEITRDEVNFKKLIGKFRTQFSNVFIDLLKTHVILIGLMKQEEWEEIENDLKFEYANDSFFFEMKQIDVMNERLNALTVADPFVGKYFANATIQKIILGRTDEEIEAERKLIKEEEKAGIVMSPEDMAAMAQGAPPPGQQDDQEKSGDEDQEEEQEQDPNQEGPASTPPVKKPFAK